MTRHDATSRVVQQSLFDIESDINPPVKRRSRSSTRYTSISVKPSNVTPMSRRRGGESGTNSTSQRSTSRNQSTKKPIKMRTPKLFRFMIQNEEIKRLAHRRLRVLRHELEQRALLHETIANKTRALFGIPKSVRVFLRCVSLFLLLQSCCALSMFKSSTHTNMQL